MPVLWSLERPPLVLRKRLGVPPSRPDYRVAAAKDEVLQEHGVSVERRVVTLASVLLFTLPQEAAFAAPVLELVQYRDAQNGFVLGALPLFCVLLALNFAVCSPSRGLDTG